MDSNTIQVRMLGAFQLKRGNLETGDGDSRSKKVWLLLACLIWNRGRVIPEQELIDLLWEGQPQGPKLSNALKTTLHRARACLDRLGGGLGLTLIQRQGDGWTWNTGIPLTLDTDVFRRLCAEESLEQRMQGLDLYQGRFLPKLAREPWADAIAQPLRQCFLETARSVLPRLEEQDRWADIVWLCRRALEEVPLEEIFWLGLLRALLQLEDRQGAAAAYEEARSLFLSRRGLLPPEDLQSLYREALSSLGDHTLTPGAVLTHIREASPPAGAYFCDYDFFRSICQSAVRRAVREGGIAHLALLSIEGEDAPLSKRSLDLVCANLREVIRTSLRSGDIAALCSASQYILLLPQANYENSQMVCDRVRRSFTRQYPHSPARLRAVVFPLLKNETP